MNFIIGVIFLLAFIVLTCSVVGALETQANIHEEQMLRIQRECPAK